MLRRLVAQPTFTLMLVLTLGLGIGATTTVWSFAYALLLRPFPYRSPGELVRVESVYTKEGGAKRGMSLLDVEDYRRQTTLLESIGAYTFFDMRLLTDGPPVVMSRADLEPEALALLGVTPILGRLLTPAENVAGGDVNKAVIAYDVWQSLFNGDPEIVGKPLRSDRQTLTIIGVMPPGFAFPDRVGAWMPMEAWYSNLGANDDRRQKLRGARFYATVARLAPGVTLAAAQAELNGIAESLERDYPRDNDGVRVSLTPLQEYETGSIRPYLLVCLAGVAFVLLICCANVANLLLVRATTRQREVAVRTALGASRARIARDLIVENIGLGLAGSLLGMLFAWVGVRGLVALIPVPLPAWMRIEIDAPVLAFSVIVGLVTSLLFGLGPLLTATRLDLVASLREGMRGTARSPVRSALVMAEIALSVVLLVGAGLLLQTFMRLQQRHPGFDSEGLAAARVVLWMAGTRTESAPALNNLHRRVLDALTSLPGVRSAAVSSSLPYASSATGRTQADVYIKGRAEQDTKTLASLSGADVSAEFFTTMHIPLIRGRLFEATDTIDAQPVVVISQRAAELFWPGQDPIGQEIAWGPPSPNGNPWTRVVGIVGNVKQQAAEADSGVELYYPFTQWPVGTSYYVVRTQGDPEAMLETIRRTITESNRSIAVSSVKTVERTMTESLWQRRLWGVLFAAFAVLALGLATVGIYGVISYAVAQRAREMGVRLAIGATPGEVRRLVVREGMTVCGYGALIGLALTLGLGQLASSLLFGVSAYDVTTYGVVFCAIAVAGLAACWLPAVRASRINPTSALHSE